MKFSPADESFMRQALELARRGEGKTAPNPMVGAVVVREGEIVGRGFHARYGGAHAEAAALRQAGKRARGSDLYVTLEPCVAFPGKKTPPCASLVAKLGVARVVLASLDPNPNVSGAGAAAIKKSKIPVLAGLLARENERLNRPYFKRHATGLPHVIAKWAMSLDGKIATRTGHSRWISSEAARQMGRELRARCGTVLVGSGTVLADNPRLRGVGRILLDSWGRTPPESNVLRTARRWPTRFAVSSSCPEDRVRALRRAGAEVHKFEVMDLRTILTRFCAMGVDRVLIEGGGEVHASALESGVVDEIYVFVAPIVLGGRDAKSPVEGTGVERVSQALRLKESVARKLPTGEVLIHGWLA